MRYVVLFTYARNKIAQSQIAQSPIAQSPIAQSPIAQSPIAQSPIVSSPIARSPIVSSPIVSSPIARSPIASSPIVSSPIAQSPIASSPIARSQRQSSWSNKGYIAGGLCLVALGAVVYKLFGSKAAPPEGTDVPEGTGLPEGTDVPELALDPPPTTIEHDTPLDEGILHSPRALSPRDEPIEALERENRSLHERIAQLALYNTKLKEEQTGHTSPQASATPPSTQVVEVYTGPTSPQTHAMPPSTSAYIRADGKIALALVDLALLKAKYPSDSDHLGLINEVVTACYGLRVAIKLVSGKEALALADETDGWVLHVKKMIVG